MGEIKPPFRPDDRVHHGPTGETWVVAYADPETGRLSWCGWPEGEAQTSDCTLVRAASDEASAALRAELIAAGGRRGATVARLYPDGPTAEMDDSRFEPVEAPQPPSFTPGEAERLVDELINVAARKGDYEGHAAGLRIDIDPATASKLAMALAAARTALLSHISTAGRGEGAGDGLGDGRRICEALGFDPINHHNALKCPYCNPNNMALVPRDPTQEQLVAGNLIYHQGEVPLNIYRTMVEVALRSGRLVERSAADTTNPQDQE